MVKASNPSSFAQDTVFANLKSQHDEHRAGALLFAAGIAAITALLLVKFFSRIVSRINYSLLCKLIILFIIIIIFVLCGWYGFMIFIVSTAIGLIPQLTGCSRAHAMGCLILPVILYFLL